MQWCISQKGMYVWSTFQIQTNLTKNLSLTSFDIFFHVLFMLFSLQPKPTENQHGYQRQLTCHTPIIRKTSENIHFIYYCWWYLDFIDEDVGHPKEFRLGRSEDCIGSEGVNRTKIGVITRLRRPWCCGLVKWWHRASKELKLQYVIGIDFQVIYQL